ncbi:hypothetical protein OSI08_27355, partial [Mycobacterium ulcerans]
YNPSSDMFAFCDCRRLEEKVMHLVEPMPRALTIVMDLALASVLKSIMGETSALILGICTDIPQGTCDAGI